MPLENSCIGQAAALNLAPSQAPSLRPQIGTGTPRQMQFMSNFVLNPKGKNILLEDISDEATP
jgi:hypothetical protein